MSRYPEKKKFLQVYSTITYRNSISPQASLMLLTITHPMPIFER